MTDSRYPIGRFNSSQSVTTDMREPAIAAIAELPSHLRSALARLTDAQMDTPYRAGGWTVRQLVHHVADSHMNAYVRMKLGLTQMEPTINAYDPDSWAILPDSRLSADVSLAVLEGVHARWTALWRSLDDDHFARVFLHPEKGRITLETQLQLYAWHSRHHVAHITTLREREGWR